MRALRTHMVVSSPSACIVDREGRCVAHQRHVMIKDVRVYAGDGDNMAFNMHVNYLPSNDDLDSDAYDDNDYVQRTYRLICSTDLELYFSENSFALWVLKVRSSFNAELIKKGRRTLDTLLKRHPEYASDRLIEITRKLSKS
jgi:hypothetical protein